MHFEHRQCLQAAPPPVFVALARLLALQGCSHSGGPLLVLNALPPDKQRKLRQAHFKVAPRPVFFALSPLLLPDFVAPERKTGMINLNTLLQYWKKCIVEEYEITFTPAHVHVALHNSKAPWMHTRVLSQSLQFALSFFLRYSFLLIGRRTPKGKAGLLVVFCPIPCYSGACIVAHALVATRQSSASLLRSRSASSRARRCCSWETNARTRHRKQHLSLAKPGRSTNNCPVRPRQGCSRSGGPLLVQSALPPDKQLLSAIRFFATHFEHRQCLQAAPPPVFVALARLLALQGCSHSGGPLLVLNALPPDKQRKLRQAHFKVAPRPVFFALFPLLRPDFVAPHRKTSLTNLNKLLQYWKILTLSKTMRAEA